MCVRVHAIKPTCIFIRPEFFMVCMGTDQPLILVSSGPKCPAEIEMKS